MSELTLEELRAELRSFTKDVLQPELASVTQKLSASLSRGIPFDGLVSPGNSDVVERRMWAADGSLELASKESLQPQRESLQSPERNSTKRRFSSMPASRSGAKLDSSTNSSPKSKVRNTLNGYSALSRHNSDMDGNDDNVASEQSPIITFREESNMEGMVHTASRHTRIRIGAQADIRECMGAEEQAPPEVGSVMRPRRILWGIVNSSAFEICSCFLLFGNLFAIGYETDYKAKNWTIECYQCWVIDVAFTVGFSLELLARVGAAGFRYFTNAWNMFDVFVIAVQFGGLFSDTKFGAIRIFRLFRLLRLLRVLRVFRILGEVTQLRMIVASIYASTSALMWTLLFVSIFTYLFSLFITQVVTDYKINLDDVDNIESDQQLLLDYYGSVFSSMLKMYQAVSEGQHWAALVEPLDKYCSPWMSTVFSFHMAFMVYGMLNVITANFLDSTLKVAVEANESVTCRKLFDMFRPKEGEEDEEDDYEGVLITEDTFYDQIESPEMVAYLRQLDLLPEEAVDLQIFKLIDMDGSGSLDIYEIIRGAMHLARPPTRFHLYSLRHTFMAEFLDMRKSLKRLEAAVETLPRRSMKLAC